MHNFAEFIFEFVILRHQLRYEVQGSLPKHLFQIKYTWVLILEIGHDFFEIIATQRIEYFLLIFLRFPYMATFSLILLRQFLHRANQQIFLCHLLLGLILILIAILCSFLIITFFYFIYQFYL